MSKTFDSSPNKQPIENKDNESFFTYSLPKSTQEELLITPTPLVVEFKFDNGCLLVFNGRNWMTPVFPERHANFNLKNKELEVLGEKYRMGDAVFASGYTTLYSSNGITNITRKDFITERLAVCLMLFYPYTRALAVARFMLGVGTALMAATATAYMIELFGSSDTTRATAWVTASTTIGFGLGPALTTASLLFYETEAPASFFLLLAAVALSIFLVWQLPETSPRRTNTSVSMLRLPYFNREVLWYGGGIFLCWATTGLILSIIPSALATHGLSKYAGISSMLAISCGLLFQPIARKLDPQVSSKLGILILLPAYALLAWGALNANLPTILLAAFLASSSCYGFVYLGGLSGVTKSAGNEQARASAGYFLMSYMGFSVPVIFTGLIIDQYGAATAFFVFGLFLLLGALVLFASQSILKVGRVSNQPIHRS